jgi:uncharacterized membrane protein YsdA (DUF1294 family)
MHLSIIVWVAVVSFVGCALIAIAVYLIDKNANRHDKHR